MERVLEKLLGEVITGSRKAQTIADDLETMFEMWTGYMYTRLGDKKFTDGLTVYDDSTFNIDGYQPTIMPVPLNIISGMTSIGVDIIKPNTYLYDPAIDEMLIAEAATMTWLIFTVVEQGHPLKGLRYIVGHREGELHVPMDDPMFTTTYDEEHFITGGLGCFIDKRERFLRAARPELYND